MREKPTSEQLNRLLDSTRLLLESAVPKSVVAEPWPALLVAFMARGVYDLRGLQALANLQCGEAAAVVARSLGEAVITASFIGQEPEQRAREYLEHGPMKRLWTANKLIDVIPETADRLDMDRFKREVAEISPKDAKKGKMSWPYSFTHMANALDAPHFSLAYADLSDTVHGSALSIGRRFVPTLSGIVLDTGPILDFVWKGQYFGVVFGIQLCDLANTTFNLGIDDKIAALLAELAGNS